MEYSFPVIDYSVQVSDPSTIYEIDLVKQWLNIHPGSVINSVNSGKITVINCGERNRHEGPDIKNVILIINDKIVQGPVECHISDTDWHRHGHQNDSNYSDVILHIIRQIKNVSPSPEIPTVLLPNTNCLPKSCSLNLNNINSKNLAIISQHGHTRWLEMINKYSGSHNNKSNIIQLLITNSLKIIGAGGNEQQFRELADNLDLTDLENRSQADIEMYLIDTIIRLNIIWLKRGIRPAQQPQNRIKLVAQLISYIFRIDFDKLYNYEKIVHSFVSNCPSASGKGIQTEILGNVIIPFYAARALYLQRTQDYLSYLQTWNSLMLPNAYQKNAKRFKGIISSKVLRSFAASQGLIAIDKKWCNKELCHLCPLKKRTYGNY